jgi:SAM-dependent methyltransferase
MKSNNFLKHLLNIIKKLVRILLARPFVIRDYFAFKKMQRSLTQRFSIPLSELDLFSYDKTRDTGFDRHYVYHTSWAARKLAIIAPQKHVDISSSLYFVGITSAFIPIDFYDYRPADLRLSNMSTNSADLTSLPFNSNSIESLSCMHTIEHVGLGRYGDKVDPDGDKAACAELSRVLTPGGSLLFVVPIGGVAKIQWNAHRIYNYETVLDLFQNLELREFSLIPEHEKDGGMISNPDPSRLMSENYACGCFHFVKPK